MTRRALLAAGASLTANAASAATDFAPAPPAGPPLPEGARRVMRADRVLADFSWGEMAFSLRSADVVFVGEQHDDPETHKIELALLQAMTFMTGGGKDLTLAMEMFERDQQPALDDHLAGSIDEEAFTKRIKLWPNYKTDYRPLVEFARTNRIPVVGTNAPARIVRQVGKEGLSRVLSGLGADDRKFVAGSVNVPLADRDDEYARRFAAVIGEGHGDGKPMDAAMIRRFFEAQCLRDDTMAESVARLLDSGRHVLHINGGFHSDAGLGTVQRLLWRRPLCQVATVKVIPFKGDVAKIDTLAERNEANYLVFVPDTRPLAKDK